eukprot:6440055-Prymnesium_polylepis.1
MTARSSRASRRATWSVSYYARGAAVTWLKMDHMLTGSLLDVACAVDPKSFFFTHVRDGKLIA